MKTTAAWTNINTEISGSWVLRNLFEKLNIKTIGDLAPGNYRISVSDNCPDNKISKTFTINTIANDLPDYVRLRADVLRCGTNCDSVKPAGVYYTVSSDPDQQYYWDNAGLYYEYCYLLNDAGTKNWKPLSSKQPEFPLFDSYMDFCGSGKTLISYIRPAGCETVTPQRVEHRARMGWKPRFRTVSYCGENPCSVSPDRRY